MDYKPLVYLAGPIAGLNYEGSTDWREYVEKRLSRVSIQSLSPMRGKEYLKGTGELQKSGYEGTLLSSNRSIVTRDRFDIQKCDIVLMNLLEADKVSIGSMVELGWADAYRKPVIVVIEPENIHQHAFVKELAGYTTDSINAAIKIIKAILPNTYLEAQKGPNE